MLLSASLMALLLGLASGATCPKAGPNGTRVFAHYMLWFDTPDKNGHWNWYKPPFKPSDGCNNTQNLATYFPPAMGAFASYDTTHIASDLALMRESCVSGVILDYQQPNTADPTRAVIDKAFPAVVSAVKNAGLEFAVMYDTSSKPDWGKNDRAAVQADWERLIAVAKANADAYLKDPEGNLMFFAFGATPMPMANTSGAEKSAFYVQDARKDTGGDTAPGVHGSFAWIEPNAAKNSPLDYLRGYYSGKCASLYPASPVPCVGAAFAGFKPVYPLGIINRSTALLRQTLDMCAAAGAIVCQVPTWNDFNEGTHIQPSYWCDGNAPNAFLDVIESFVKQV